MLSTETYSSAALLTSSTMTANITSNPVALTGRLGCSFQPVWTGSPVGTVKVQVSVDGTNYSDYEGSSVAVNGAGSTVFNVTNAFFLFARVVYTFTSGTGSLSMTASAKG
jgi:hypothetical protein